MIYAIDFDGTLVHSRYPYCEHPNNDLIDYIKSHRKGNIWILNTCRSGKQLRLAVKYLHDKCQLDFDYVNENCDYMIEKYGDTRKIYADIYIDHNSCSDNIESIEMMTKKISKK